MKLIRGRSNQLRVLSSKFQVSGLDLNGCERLGCFLRRRIGPPYPSSKEEGQLPRDTPYPVYDIKMSVTTDDWKLMLKRKGGDPYIIRWNHSTALFKLVEDQPVMPGCLQIDEKNIDGGDQFIQPRFQCRRVSGTQQAETIFTDNDDWQMKISFGEQEF